MEEGLFAGSETGGGGGGGYVGYLTWLRNVSEKAWVWRRVSLLVVRLHYEERTRTLGNLESQEY